MIIACPECTSPFQVLDDQIAALLQVECPTCRFRMILDFEAANDASLQEAGMRMAQGFRDEAAYRQAVGDGSVSYEAAPARPRVPTPEPEPVRAAPQPAARPAPEPEPAPEPARPAVRVPTPTPAPTPAVVQPAVAPTLEPVHTEAPTKPPVRARPTLIAPGAPPPVRQPPTPQAISQHELGTEARIDTHVGPRPGHDFGDEYELEPEPAAPVEVPRPADRTQLEVPADEFAVDFDEPELEPEPEVPVRRRKPAVEPEADAEPSTRTPPHSPSVESGKSKPARDDVPEVDDKGKAKPDGKKKGSFLRTFFVSLFLLIVVAATGLIVWSVIETNDPNPLPMLRDKFGLDLSQYGIPVGGSSEAPAPAPADAAPAQ